MDYYAGIDVSLEQSSVCVVDAAGKIVCEAKVASEPEALVRFFGQLSMRVTRIGLEAGPLSQWLHAGLSEAGLETVLLETRHVKAALSAMIVKTDRKDARGIAQLLRMGWFRPVHRKSADAQEVRALLVGRKLLQSKLRDVEFSIRGILRGFGLKVGEVSKGRFAARVEELIAGHAMLEAVVGAKLLYADGKVQHAGVILGVLGVAGHVHKGFNRHDYGYFSRLQLCQNLSCVTAACMVMPKALFEAIGGFDARNLAIAFNDVDLCIRIRQEGHQVIWTPYAELYHLESASRGSDLTPENRDRFAAEVKYMQERWGDVLRSDPYYNPNLSLDATDFSLAGTPRVTRPWQAYR